MSNLKITNEGVMLCCGKAACPTVAKTEEGGFMIKDDFGGSVVLSLKEIHSLPRAISLLAGSQFPPGVDGEFGPFAKPVVR